MAGLDSIQLAVNKYSTLTDLLCAISIRPDCELKRGLERSDVKAKAEGDLDFFQILPPWPAIFWGLATVWPFMP
jgi:hypothetical protein